MIFSDSLIMFLKIFLTNRKIFKKRYSLKIDYFSIVPPHIFKRVGNCRCHKSMDFYALKIIKICYIVNRQHSENIQ